MQRTRVVMADDDAATTARLILLYLIVAYYVAHVAHIGFYDRMHTAWQLTIWSMHAAPVVALRLSTLSSVQFTCGVITWVALSLRCRRQAAQPWSASFVVIELAAALVPLTPQLLGALLLLQAVIVVGFWMGMLVAARSESFSFLPLDRDLHRGWRHMLTSRQAQRRLVHDLGGHGLQQALFASALWTHASMTGAVIGDAVALVGGYAAIVVTAAAAFPPHELPYLKLRVRRSRIDATTASPAAAPAAPPPAAVPVARRGIAQRKRRSTSPKPPRDEMHGMSVVRESRATRRYSSL